MKIPPALLPLIDPGRREIPSLLKQLQVGQQLSARVLSAIEPGLLRLQIATQELLARSQVTLPAGTRLRLEVAKGAPVPELRILRETPAAGGRQLAVRSAMPGQMSPAMVREALVGIRHELSGRTAAPAQQRVLTAFENILQRQGVELARLTPARLRQAIRLSGLYHEPGMVAGGAPEPLDAKAQLLRLWSLARGAARTAPPAADRSAADRRPPGTAPRAVSGDSLLDRLVRLIEGSVARIQLHQAASLPQEDGQRQVWQLDLPIQLADERHELMLRIEREVAHGPETAPTWAVSLSFEFGTIGHLQCRIGLAGARVSTTFWSSRESTHARLERRLPVLHQAFEAQGLEVVHLAGVLGEPATPLVGEPRADRLLDEHA